MDPRKDQALGDHVDFNKLLLLVFYSVSPRITLFAMGIRGFLQLINENKDRVCTKAVLIKGKLIVDGFGVLHDLYGIYKLKWCGHECYADQHKAMMEFFEALTNAGVEAVVVLVGGGSKTHFHQNILRGNRYMNALPEELDQYHMDHGNSVCISQHHLPQLARHVYKCSLEELDIAL